MDRPQPGVTTFATLGLSDTPILGRLRPPLGTELLGACEIPRTLSATLRHAMLVPPFLWEEGLDPAVVDYKTVAWLLAVPISDAEAQFRAEHGADALESGFEEAEMDILNPNRHSVV